MFTEGVGVVVAAAVRSWIVLTATPIGPASSLSPVAGSRGALKNSQIQMVPLTTINAVANVTAKDHHLASIDLLKAEIPRAVAAGRRHVAKADNICRRVISTGLCNQIQPPPCLHDDQVSVTAFL